MAAVKKSCNRGKCFQVELGSKIFTLSNWAGPVNSDSKSISYPKLQKLNQTQRDK